MVKDFRRKEGPPPQVPWKRSAVPGSPPRIYNVSHLPSGLVATAEHECYNLHAATSLRQTMPAHHTISMPKYVIIYIYLQMYIRIPKCQIHHEF